VLWHGAGKSFSAGNDIEDFLKNPPGKGESPQSQLDLRVDQFREAARCRRARRSHRGWYDHAGSLRLVYAGASAKFQLPFVNLGIVPELEVLSASDAFRIYEGSRADSSWASHLVGLAGSGAWTGHAGSCLIRVSWRRQRKLRTRWLQKPAAAVQACKLLMKRAFRDQLEQAVKRENDVFAERVRSDEAKQAFQAFVTKRKPA